VKTDNRRLARVVGDQTGYRCLAHRRCHVYDVPATAGRHQGQRVFGADHERVGVDLEDAPREDVVLIQQRTGGHDPGVVDECVQRADAILGVANAALASTAASSGQ
jgi:hypothetical protein